MRESWRDWHRACYFEIKSRRFSDIHQGVNRTEGEKPPRRSIYLAFALRTQGRTPANGKSLFWLVILWEAIFGERRRKVHWCQKSTGKQPLKR